jgi:hypothetical protein
MGVSADLFMEDGVDNTLAYPVGVESTDTSTPEAPREDLKDSQGRYRTQSLFYESRHDSYPAYFTMKKGDIERDGVSYISFYRKYMEIADPTEYAVAQQMLGSWDHWQLLSNVKWFKEPLEKWRAELAVKLESERFHEMVDHIDRDRTSPQAIQATKWLAEKYGKKPDPKRGRPSKAEKAVHLQRLREDSEEQQEDAERIGLVN